MPQKQIGEKKVFVLYIQYTDADMRWGGGGGWEDIERGK